MNDAEASRSRTRHLVLAWLPAVLYMLLIWTLSSFPMMNVPIGSVPFKDKGVHFVEYGVLSFLLSHALRGSWPRLGAGRRFLIATVGTLVWGMLDEIHQAYVPGRQSDINDVVADALGALLGASLFWLLHTLRAANSQTSSS